MVAIGPHEILRWAAVLAAFVGVSEQPTWYQICVQSRHTEPAILAEIEIIPAVHSTQELFDPDKIPLDKPGAYFDNSFRPPAFDEL